MILIWGFSLRHLTTAYIQKHAAMVGYDYCVVVSSPKASWEMRPTGLNETLREAIIFNLTIKVTVN